MREVLMGAGARKVVETCARLRPGERLLIVTDFERVAIARVLTAARAPGPRTFSRMARARCTKGTASAYCFALARRVT